MVGNEKGGSGKSTTAMHLMVALMRDGYAVGSVDLDARQWTMTRYLSNRNATVKREGADLPLPQHYFVPRSDKPDRGEAEAEEQARFLKIVEHLRPRVDYIIMDCAGSDSFIARLAHSYADTLVTPLNDSFLDLDVLVIVDAGGRGIVKPSVYAEMVWEQRKLRAQRDRGSIDWVVMRNRLSNLNSRSKRDLADVLGQLSRRIGFRLAPGFSERVVFREMFPRGLTLLDMLEMGETGGRNSISMVAARQEVRSLIAALQLPERAPRQDLSAA